MAGFNLNIGGANIGSGAGAAASKGCGGGCGAIFGVIFGLILIPVGFYLAYYGEARLVDHGRVFERIEMSQPDAAAALTGELVKIQGQPKGSFLSIEEWDGQVLYWRESVEEYEREEDSEGDVSYDWNSVSSDNKWVDGFTVGPIQVRPSGANPVGEVTVYSAYKRGYETSYHVNNQPNDPEVGDRRREIEVLDATKPVIILGEMGSGAIQGGSSFVVSTLNEDETLATLKTEYKMAYWGMKAGAVFLIFFGIMAVFGPLTTLVGYVPLVGDHLSCAFAAIAFVFAAVSVGIITIFIKAFWFLIVIAVLGVAYLIYRGATSPRARPGGDDSTGGGLPGPVMPPDTHAAAPQQPQPSVSDTTPPGAVGGVPRPMESPQSVEPAPDVHPTPPPQSPVEQAATEDASAKFCANCGTALDPGSKFCQSCGHRVE